MIKKILTSTSLCAAAMVSIARSSVEMKKLIREIARVEEVDTAVEYVAVRFARGDYYNRQGLSTMVYDYKFYKTISKFND